MEVQNVPSQEPQAGTGKMGDERPAVTVGAKRTLEYVFDCASRFNRGVHEVTLKSFEQGISKGAEVSQILAKHLGIQLVSTNIRQLKKKNTNFTCMETILRCSERVDTGDFISESESDFVEFPVYHLLLDSLLQKRKKLIIEWYDPYFSSQSSDQPTSKSSRMLTISVTQAGFRCTPAQDLLQIIGRKTEEDRKRRKSVLGSLVSAFCRCGLLLSPRWEEVSEKLSDFDDLVLGVDTNILYDCSITQQLLDGLIFAGPFDHVHSPNWVLVVVPSAVMHEVEQAANSRDKNGSLTFEGRKGFRALQEIMELDQSKDILGISLLIVGEANPVLDTRVELRGLREDMKETAPQQIQPKLYRKLSAGDTIIRDQFKSFLRQISFHKGSFFVTGDKSNAALAQAEGLRSIYYPPPPWDTMLLLGQEVEPQSIEFESERATLSIPLGKLIYELAVEFGEISVGWGSDTIRLRCDSRGESLDHWVNRDLQINSKDLRKLVENYNTHGKFGLARASKLWREVGSNMMGSL